MMKKIIPKFNGNIDESGKLHLDDIDSFKNYLKSLKGNVDIIIKQATTKNLRSNEQNKYYWGIVLPLIADFMGDTPESAHNAMGLQFLMDRTKILNTVKSTASLNTAEFEEYMQNIRQFMDMEFNVYIPKPNECDY